MINGKHPHILVAGAAGFIGSHVVDVLLASGANVTGFDSLLTGRRSNLDHLRAHPRFDFLEGDIIAPLPSAVRKRHFTRIYNLACAASPPHYQADPEHTMLTSVVGTHALLRLAEANGARLLLSSTSEVYGDPDQHPQREDYHGNVNCTGPRACYDEGKRAAETLAFDFLRARRVEARIARIFNTYGPRMRADDGRVVSNIVCQALGGTPITVYGDGSQTRSFAYVSDLVAGLVALMEHPGPLPGPVNLGNPVELTILDLIERVLAMTGSRSPVVRRPLPQDDPRRRRPDIARAQSLLGWQPSVALADGLPPTIAWFAAEQAADVPLESPARIRMASAA